MYSETQNLDYSYDDAGEAAGDELDTPGEPHTEPGSEADVSLAATDYTKGTTRGRAADEVTKLRTALKQAEQRARDAEVEVITLRARLETVRSALRLAMSASEAAAAALANSGVSDMMLTPLPKATGASHPGSVPGGSGSPLATSAVSARPAGFGAGLAPAAAAAAAAALAAASGTSDAIAADPLVVDGEADSKTDGDNDDAEEGEDESPQPVAGEIAAVVNTPQAMEEDGDEAGLA